MASQSDIVSQMITSLAITEPGLDTSVGTPARKILDVVAEAIAEAYVDTHLLNYQYDIDAKSDASLDDFVALFGFTRLPAARATGTIVFSRTTAATQDIIIPIGTQVGTLDATPIYASTVVPAILGNGLLSVEVPVQATYGGASGNVLANTLVFPVNVPDGIGSATNPSALVGGTDPETDAQLRARFKATVFRNLAGTEGQFIGTALENPNVTQANVVGASKHFREQVQISGGSATSVLSDAGYVYPGSSTFGPDIDDGDILSPGVNYTFDATSNPPVISVIGSSYPDAGGTQDFEGAIFDLDYEYLPAASRNDPTQGITNRIDLFVNGVDAQQATQAIVFNDSFDQTLVADPTSMLYVGNFTRNTGDPAVSGNRFLPLSFGPILSLPNYIIIGTTSYLEGTHYWPVYDSTPKGLAFGSLAGIEWAAFALPTNGSNTVITYNYNAVPKEVSDAVANWKLVGTDLSVHQAKTRMLRLNIVVMYTAGFSPSSVNDSIVASVTSMFAGLGFNSIIQVSDVEDVIHQTQGVDNVRFINATDSPGYQGDFYAVANNSLQPVSPGYAIQEITPLGGIVETFASGGYASDIILGDDEVPALDSIYIEKRAQNTFNRTLQ